ncbi:MAG TPA: DUF1800 domain-containing protein [Gammaproteobacteria bacterium]|nr:DUF1800 domain-containing protein [Gammaproteobacteria bacterium]
MPARARWSAVVALALAAGAAAPFTAKGVAPTAGISHDDLLWLNRITYGANAATVAAYERLGRGRFLDAQLRPHDELPAETAAQIQRFAITEQRANAPEARLAAVTAENERINALTSDDDKQAARKALNDEGNALAYEAARRHVLRAVYSSAQLEEQLTWFWLNHFSVFQGKANIRWLIADYESSAIRPHVLGHFRDLVLATLEHPAMLQYLDNAQNAVGHLNENYARELMELHVLGVHAGYTQHDVEELARVLTGAGVNASGKTPQLKPDWQKLYRRNGAFEFNPARHDFGKKTVLGHEIVGGGLVEIERTVDLLVAQPACARFVSGRLAEFFLGQAPPPRLLDQLAKSFGRTGDIEAVLRKLFASREFAASLGKEFKDPMHFVISTLRLAYEDKPILNTRPVINWLNALGEPLYGRQTPDGYPLDERYWTSSGQLSKRFEIARAIGSSGAGLFDRQDDSDPQRVAFPQLTTRFYFDDLEKWLGARTKAALDQATSQAEWNTYLLSSPELNYR